MGFTPSTRRVVAMIKTDFRALQAAAFARPFVSPGEELGAELMRYAGNGWWVGLSVNH